MICLSCYQANSRVTKTVDLRDAILRTHKCPACSATWATEETLRKGTLVNAPVQVRPLALPNSQERPPNAVNQPSVAVPGHGGVGGGLPSGSVSDPISLPDPSRQAPQDHAAGARDLGVWDSGVWFEKFSEAWAGARGVERYGATEADHRAQGKLQATLFALPEADLIAAQRDADRMFAEFFARETGRVAEEGHPFYFFAPAFNGLRVQKAPAAARGTAPARAGSAERAEEILDGGRTWTPREATG